MMQLQAKTFFLVASIVVFCYFVFRLRMLKLNQLTQEQQLIWPLLALLIGFNDPFFILNLYWT